MSEKTGHSVGHMRLNAQGMKDWAERVSNTPEAKATEEAQPEGRTRSTWGRTIIYLFSGSRVVLETHRGQEQGESLVDFLIEVRMASGVPVLPVSIIPERVEAVTFEPYDEGDDDDEDQGEGFAMEDLT